MVQTSISKSYKSKKKTSTKEKAKAASEPKLPCAVVKARWEEEVARTQWKYDEWYKHPKGTQTIARNAAMDLPKSYDPPGHKLKKEELDTLPYEERFANNGAIMKLHDLVDVVLLIRKRAKWLDRTVATERLRPSSAPTEVLSAQAGPSSSTIQEPESSAP